MLDPRRFQAVGFVPLTAVLAGLLATSLVTAGTDSGTLSLVLRDRAPSESAPELFQVRERPQHWDAKKTAVIICDMWDRHWCQGCHRRV